MYPVSLNLASLSIALIGNGAAALRRLEALKKHGAKNITVFADSLPEELSAFTLILIVDLPDEQAFALAKKARALGKLVNVEDRPEHCDFYFASFFERGDLGISVHTNGKSPALGSIIRDYLSALFPEHWSARVEEIAALRDQLKRTHATHAEIREHTERHVQEKNWLPKFSERDAA